MKIAILNESFLKDRHIQRLKMLGEVVQYTDTVDEHTTIERLEGVDIAVADCWLTQLNETLFSQAPQLKFVSLNSTGYDQVDLAAATRHKVAIANVPGFSTEGVAEHAIALMFAAVRHITAGTIAMHPQPFQVDPSNAENASAYLGMTLRDKTMGVIGFGKIGSRVAELAQGLGMKVVAYNRTAKEAPGVTFVSLNELLQQSDVVSLNSALSEDLVNIIDAKALELMKPTAYIINTARGEMIDEAALANALDEVGS